MTHYWHIYIIAKSWNSLWQFIMPTAIVLVMHVTDIFLPSFSFRKAPRFRRPTRYRPYYWGMSLLLSRDRLLSVVPCETRNWFKEHRREVREKRLSFSAHSPDTLRSHSHLQFLKDALYWLLHSLKMRILVCSLYKILAGLSYLQFVGSESEQSIYQGDSSIACSSVVGCVGIPIVWSERENEQRGAAFGSRDQIKLLRSVLYCRC